MAAPLPLYLLGVWLASQLLLYILYLARREWFESRGVRVYPFLIIIQRRVSWRGIGGGRLARLFFSIGVAVLVYTAFRFYEFIAVATAAKVSGASAAPAVTVLIPCVTVGCDTFLYMLPGIVAAVAAHEVMHALAARVEGVEVRSTGFMLVAGVIPAAFVEPDEEGYMRLGLPGKLRILSAGVYANFILALLFASLIPLIPTQYSIVVIGVEKGMPAYGALKPGDVIVAVNGTRVSSLETLRSLIQSSHHVVLTVERNGRLLNLTLETRLVDSVRRIGVYLQLVPLNPLYQIVYWAWLLNEWLALFNAAPLIVTDGGKALTETLRRLLGERGVNLSVALQAVTLALLALNFGLFRVG